MLVRTRLACALTALAIACGLVAPLPALAAKAPAGPAIYARAAILVSSDGVVLWSKSPDAPRRVASTTKMLTSLVVREHMRLDDVIRVAPKAVNVDGGAVGLRTGERITVRQLLAVMLVHSANGAAEALAIGVAGSEKKFVTMMRAKAIALGLPHTRPADPHGLSPKGVSTAADLAVISRQLMADPVLRAMVLQRSAQLPHGSYGSTDKLLGQYPGLEGIKTGYTDPAGYCFAGAAKRNGVELFCVVLGTDEPAERFTQTRRLLDWGFAHARREPVISRDTTLGTVEVQGGESTTVTVHAEKPVDLIALPSVRGLTTQVSLQATTAAPVTAGQRMGVVSVLCRGCVVASAPLVADAAVDRSAPAPAVGRASSAPRAAAQTGFWVGLARVWAGLGRLLGI